jgi:hypothetical protein
LEGSRAIIAGNIIPSYLQAPNLYLSMYVICKSYVSI